MLKRVKQISIDFINIDLCINDSSWGAYLERLEPLILKLLAYIVELTNLHEYSKQIELCVVLSGDDELCVLNLQYLGKDKPTNVLSFPACEMDLKDIINMDNRASILILGDVFLSYQTLLKESNERNISFEDHFLHLLTHGTLHLLGFDHITENEAEQMENLEIAILKHFGVESPYENIIR